MVNVRSHLRRNDEGQRGQVVRDVTGQLVVLPSQERPGKLRRLGGAFKSAGNAAGKKLKRKRPSEELSPGLVELARNADEMAGWLEEMER